MLYPESSGWWEVYRAFSMNCVRKTCGFTAHSNSLPPAACVPLGYAEVGVRGPTSDLGDRHLHFSQVPQSLPCSLQFQRQSSKPRARHMCPEGTETWVLAPLLCHMSHVLSAPASSGTLLKSRIPGPVPDLPSLLSTGRPVVSLDAQPEKRHLGYITFLEPAEDEF